MQKYKIVASKSQKKYTIILSADSETQAKEKLHKEDYSILSISKLTDKDIEGQKFIFQVEHDGDIKNWVIIWKDIFKVYVKLKDELGYHILFLYPEGDEAHTNAQKKQKIMDQLEHWYELQKKRVKIKEEKQKWQESFYLKKQLDDTYKLIEQVLGKLDVIFNNKQKYHIDDETFLKLEHVYEKLVHIKWSTNLVKLKEIWELALVKIAQVELKSVEKKRNKESRELLKQTNTLLKKIGSNKQFIEPEKDFKKIFLDTLNRLTSAFSIEEAKKNYLAKKSSKKILDTQSYGFLKTILLLEKYKEKLDANSKEMRKNILLFLNPFNHSELKDKILLKRKVIKQNIQILRVKKTWGVSSYTWVKKWYHKILDQILLFILFLKKLVFTLICVYASIFLISIVWNIYIWDFLSINAQALWHFLLFYLAFLLLYFSRNFFLFSINIVFFTFIFIFSTVNF